MELNTLNLWLGILAIITSWLLISFGYFYRAKRTEEITKEIAQELKVIGPKIIEYGLVIEQNDKRQDLHEKRCEEDKKRMDSHLKNIYRKLDELKR